MQTFLNVYFTSSSPACQIFLVDSKMFVSTIAALTEITACSPKQDGCMIDFHAR